MVQLKTKSELLSNTNKKGGKITISELRSMETCALKITDIGMHEMTMSIIRCCILALLEVNMSV